MKIKNTFGWGGCFGVEIEIWERVGKFGVALMNFFRPEFETHLLLILR